MHSGETAGAPNDWLARLPERCAILRDYQRAQVAELHAAILAGHRRVLAQLPTGGGKSHEIAAVTAAAEVAGHRVLILATRTRLIRQISERLLGFGVLHGVIAAPLKHLTNAGRPVQVASVDTLYRRCIADERAPLPGADIVVFDEAHLALATTRVAILERYPDALLLGFTATPARRSGKPLSDQFDVLIQGESVRELIDLGQLVRPRIFNVPVMSAEELAAVPKDATRDYQASALGALMAQPKLVGDVVENWLRIAVGKRTLVFAISQAHGQALVEQFCSAGVAAELLTDADDEDTREAVVARLEAGETTVVVNCFLMSYGVDIPSIECIVMARPTRSVVLYLQCVGRGLRPAEGKADCILIDHGRVVENLGLPTDDLHWTLDAGSNVNDQAAAARARATGDEAPRTCPDCAHLWLVSEEGNRCKCCGWEPRPVPRAVATTAANLVEFGGAGAATAPHAPECVQFYTEALAWYARRWPHRWLVREKSGRWWAWSQTRQRFEFAGAVRMPSRLWEIGPAATVSPGVAGWLKAAAIRFVKSKRSAMIA